MQFPPWVGHLNCSELSMNGQESTSEPPEPWSRATSSGTRAPEPLHTAFDTSEVWAWEPARFEMVGKVQDAVRNRGQVHQMVDTTRGKRVAVKCMPNDWVCSSHDDFVKQHPHETELPWQDIACSTFLNGIHYPYRCPLIGVYRDDETTNVVTELASEGDLFSWCSGCVPEKLGPAREARVLPLARQIVDSVRQLHELSIVHRDVSLENILLSRELAPDARPSAPEADEDDVDFQIQVIDFGMTSTCRLFEKGACGKPSYQAPEVHTDKQYDGFLSDAFAVGVTLYCLLVGDYPWLSTRPGGCKCFDYVARHGFRAYLKKRKLRGGGGTVGENMSEPLVALLEGLLASDPNKRLTLGESVFDDGIGGARRSVLDEPWMRDGKEPMDI